jgi:hypothetical protein
MRNPGYTWHKQRGIRDLNGADTRLAVGIVSPAQGPAHHVPHGDGRVACRGIGGEWEVGMGHLLFAGEGGVVHVHRVGFLPSFELFATRPSIRNYSPGRLTFIALSCPAE